MHGANVKKKLKRFEIVLNVAKDIMLVRHDHGTRRFPLLLWCRVLGLDGVPPVFFHPGRLYNES